MSISESVIYFGIAAIVWLACGFVSMGFRYASEQRRWPRLAERDRHEDAVQAIFEVPFGCSALLVSLLCRDYRFGWLLPWRKP